MRTKTVLFVVVFAVAVPVSVYASHQFDDVPSSHTFHSSIAWLAETGITRGCNPPANDEFCPDDPVTRGQMATFLERFHDQFVTNTAVGIGVASRSSAASPSGGNGVVYGLTLNMDVPVAGVLIVTASVDIANPSTSDAFFCGINTGGSTAQANGDSWRVIDLTTSAADTCSTQTAYYVAPGSETARVVLTQALASTEAYAGSISAMLYSGSGVFGLLGEDERNIDAPREVSDTPKGG